MKQLKAVWRQIMNTLFPPVCVSCKTEGDFLCRDCIQKLTDVKIKSGYGQLRKKEYKNLDGVIYGLDYAKNPQIKAAVKQFKYKYTKELADHFANIIVKKIRELNMTKGKNIILIPVPLHKSRFNERGFNQAELIAKAVKKKLGPMVEISPMLFRSRQTSQQAKLSKDQRHQNLKGAFRIVLNKNGKHLNHPEKLHFIVDDVCTTGATLENCAETLKKEGLEKVYGLVVARAFKELR